MRKIVFMMSLLLTLGLFSACSSDGEEVFDGKDNVIDNGEKEDNGVPNDTLGTINVLQIQSSKGDAETCELLEAKCVTGMGSYTSYDTYSSRKVYPFALMARIEQTSIFNDSIRPYNYLLIYIETSNMININGLKVGDTFDSSAIRLNVNNYLCEVNNAYIYLPEYRAQGGHIQVVDKKIGDDGKQYLTLNLQDIEAVNSYYEICTYTFNATVDYEICDYTPDEPNMEELTKPTDRLVYFMMDALSNEYQGRHVLFSEETGAQECLIINDKNELKEVYKGNWDGYIDVPFEYCSLVIGHTYGEDGSVTVGDFDLADNGDAYQLNLTLNNNVNINYVYSPGYVDLYFWKLIPKVVSKPVVFNRINQDVSIDPLGADTPWAKMQRRWFLESYSDAEGTGHQVSDFGDEHYAIEFKGNGTFEAHTPTNDFSGDYGLPYTLKLTNSENFNCDDLHYGVFSVRDWTATNVNDDDLISKAFMRIIPNATQFKLWSTDFLVIRLSDKEYLSFFREGMKSYYGL